MPGSLQKEGQKTMKENDLTVKVTRWLIYLDAVIWLFLGLIIALDLHPAIPEGPIYRWGMSSLTLLTGFSLMVLYKIVTTGNRFALFLLVIEIALLSILTITDEFGFIDLIVLIINLIIFILLLKDKEVYLNH
jgi:hypothetical protein